MQKKYINFLYTDNLIEKKLKSKTNTVKVKKSKTNTVKKKLKSETNNLKIIKSTHRNKNALFYITVCSKLIAAYD